METIILENRFTHMSNDDLLEFCAQNHNLKIERDANQNIIIMSPLASDFSDYNAEITAQLVNWNKLNKSGKVFDSSAGFVLQNGAMRSPDAAWMSNERRTLKPKEAGRKFLELCPEFIIELMSPSDNLKVTKEKMIEWISNGCLLAFLIHPDEKKVFIYKQDGSVSEQTFDNKISGENILPGFELDLSFLNED